MNNFIIGAMHNKQDISFNFILQNEQTTDYPCVDIELERVVMDPNSIVRKIKLREY